MNTRSMRRLSSSSRRSSATKVVSARQAQGNLALEVARLKRTVNFRRPERKYADISLSLSNVLPGTGALVVVNQIAQGTSQVQRVGEKIKTVSLYAAGYVNMDTASFDVIGTYFWRVYFVCDKEGSATDALNLFPDSQTLPVNQLKNNLYLDRFKVIYDSGPMPLTSPQGATAQVPARNWFRFSRRFKRKISYNGSSSSSYNDNTILMLLYTNANIGSGGSLDFTGSSRLTFVDT